ncbi:nuclear transport factor 2 family protein [Streptomyces sp. NPDC008121]|uniref:nuclear transport factor 2 family protein n=1 Tax=Streptomyces sp. NPDC008121 TaxID=3364809 RepID=UPI0036E48FF9
MYDVSARSPQEIFTSHGKALESEDLDAIAANFAENAMLVTPRGVRVGREGIREGFAELFADLPRARWDLKVQTFAGDFLFLEWSAAGSGHNHAAHGVDVFIFRDGLIQAQTFHYTLAPTS